MLAAALLAATSLAGTAQAGIFGHRSRHTPQQSPSASRAHNYPTQSRNPWDWHEAHRGYGVKIRGW
jgi:hypothetical protein